MSLYVPVLVSLLAGTHWEAVGGTMHDLGLAGYLAETGVNLLFAFGVILLWRLMKRHSKATNYVVIALVALGMYGLLLGALSVGVYYFWMLGIAVLGLYLRPPIEPLLDHIIRWALYMAAILLGVLLIDGINVLGGVALGFAAYSAQIIVGLLLTNALPHKDRMHIAFAQQNGITAIILALLFETYYPGTIAIVAPAIVTINTVHFLANKVLDAHLAGDRKRLGMRHHMEKLKTHIHKA